jgi:hypothetical protein
MRRSFSPFAGAERLLFAPEAIIIGGLGPVCGRSFGARPTTIRAAGSSNPSQRDLCN